MYIIYCFASNVILAFLKVNSTAGKSMFFFFFQVEYIREQLNFALYAHQRVDSVVEEE